MNFFGNDVILSHDFLGFCSEASWLILLAGALVVATVSAGAAAGVARKLNVPLLPGWSLIRPHMEGSG